MYMIKLNNSISDLKKKKYIAIGRLVHLFPHRNRTHRAEFCIANCRLFYAKTFHMNSKYLFKDTKRLSRNVTAN